MARNLLTMRPQRSAAVRIRAARCASSPTSLDTEHSLGSGVEVENDAVIVSDDDPIEGTFGYPVKTWLAVTQRRGRLVMRDRDPISPAVARCLHVGRLPASFLDTIIKAEPPTRNRRP
jgi:hypothetical protein